MLSQPGVIGMAPSFGLGWSGPLVPLEMRIAESTSDVDATIDFREASKEDVERYCPNIPTYERIAREAMAKVERDTGLSKGPVFGTKVHKAAKDTAKLEIVEEKLKEMGLVKGPFEEALLKGERRYILAKGLGYRRIYFVPIHLP